MADQPQKKKIIIDEDWKTQVQAEKEKLHQGDEAASPESAAGAEQLFGESERAGFPPPSLLTIVSILATEAMVGLGQIPSPLTGQPQIALEQGKYFIDLLEVLQQKSAGNRTEEEDRELTDLLHHLRMAYVAAQKSGGTPPSPTE